MSANLIDGLESVAALLRELDHVAFEIDSTFNFLCQDRMKLRIYRSDGAYVEVAYSALLLQPESREIFLTVAPKDFAAAWRTLDEGRRETAAMNTPGGLP